MGSLPGTGRGGRAHAVRARHAARDALARLSATNASGRATTAGRSDTEVALPRAGRSDGTRCGRALSADAIRPAQALQRGNRNKVARICSMESGSVARAGVMDARKQLRTCHDTVHRDRYGGFRLSASVLELGSHRREGTQTGGVDTRVRPYSRRRRRSPSSRARGLSNPKIAAQLFLSLADSRVAPAQGIRKTRK